MATLTQGWHIQARVIKALMIRELYTRFGRDNIGFLWMMVEPLLFPALVAVMWRFMKGSDEHGISVIAYVVSGYVPLTLFRHGVNRSAGVFSANASLMYHRQIKLLDFIFVRFLIEMIGSMMSFVLIAIILLYFDLMPVPANPGYLLAGWLLYCAFSFSLCLVLAPLSEVSEVLEKFLPVTTYIVIPFSGTFNQTSWLAPGIQDIMIWSPFVDAMEMIRYGIFGHDVDPIYNIWVPIIGSLVFTVVGLALCRSVRRKMVVE
ncbi:capsule biosynthesis protein [Nostoc sp. 3335mG]|nr:capsule biosynthesis protein [Nostoc sp. 3335mG]